MTKISSLLLAITLLLAFTGCKSFEAKRMDDRGIDEKAMSITDKWVDGDTELVIKGTIEKIYKHRRFKKYNRSRAGKDIKLFVGEVSNNTSEAYFPIDDMNDALLNELSDSDVFVLIDAAQRDRLLKEITYQNDGMVDPAQAKTIGKQSGADLMIFGAIHMKPKTRGGKTVKTYTVNFRLTNIETGEEVCRTREKINKYSEQSGSGW